MNENELKPEVAKIRQNPLAIHPLFLNRWSPRSYLENKPVSNEDLQAVLDAARWAPSCFNEQPWRFIVTRTPEDRQRMRLCLTPGNQSWTQRAPILLSVIGNPHFALDGKPNRWNAFDSGTAWGYLALEAARRGLIAHGMGGFSQEKIRATFGVPDDWGVFAVIALGYQGPLQQLTPEEQARELPSTRKPLTEIWCEGKFAFTLDSF